MNVHALLLFRREALAGLLELVLREGSGVKSLEGRDKVGEDSKRWGWGGGRVLGRLRQVLRTDPGVLSARI